MRKILNIGGNDVAFECNAVTSIFYKAEFGKNMFAEFLKINKVADVLTDPQNAPNEVLDEVDFDIITRLAWVCAKSASPKDTKPFIDWLIENKDFNAFTDGIEIIKMVMDSFQTKKN